MQAVIDIGSNTIVLLAGKFLGQKFNEILNISKTAMLAKGLEQTGVFSKESMDKTLIILNEYKVVLEEYEISNERIIVVATEAARKANNRQEFFVKIQNELGLTVETLSEEGEANYAALGVLQGLKDGVSAKETVIMDLGGASTELIKVSTNPFNVNSFASFPIGAVNATNWDLKGEFTQRVGEILGNKLDDYKTDKLFCVGGTVTSFAAITENINKYSDMRVHGIKLPIEKFNLAANKLLELSEEQVLKKYPFLGLRAHVLRSGVKAVKAIIKSLNVQSIEISAFGLRQGILHEGQVKDNFYL